MNTSIEELACLYVLDQLDPKERAEFEARLVKEPAIAAAVREAEAALAARVRALPPHEPGAELLARLEDRLEGETSHTNAKVVPLPVSHAVLARRWSVLGALAALVAVGLGFGIAQRVMKPAAPQSVIVVVGLDGQRSTRAEMTVSGRARNADARFVQLAAMAEQYWEKPHALPTGSGDGSGSGYALFDPSTRQGFIGVRQLPPLAAGQQYHLWVLDSATAQIRDAGVLPLETTNQGMFFFSVDAAEAKPGQVSFFVTVENAASPSAKPTGKVVLGRGPI